MIARVHFIDNKYYYARDVEDITDIDVSSNGSLLLKEQAWGGKGNKVIFAPGFWKMVELLENED